MKTSRAGPPPNRRGFYRMGRIQTAKRFAFELDRLGDWTSVPRTGEVMPAVCELARLLGGRR